ncbi:MAG: hypothetical protein KGL39_49630, partial [Patescibacteria group bacterium]|nr:hypothetical protein [Patescibacteria group bacterium]
GGPGGNGQTGTTTTGGNGGVPTGSSLTGGNGAIPGQPGSPGANGFYTDTVASIYNGPVYGAQGGFAGRAINLNGQAASVITWLGGNNGIQVKGAVS